MSVKVMSWVWDHSSSKGMDRLVLLAIADCASDDGGNAYPSMAKLVDKTGMTDRGVQKCIGRLVAAGELSVSRNGGPRGCNRYRVIMVTPERDSPPNHVHPEPRSPRTTFTPPEHGSPPPRTTFTPTPEHGSPGTVLEPSLNRQGGRASAPKRPPPPKCPTHLNDPDPPPCGACGDRRRARADWDRDQAAQAAHAQQQRARRDAEAKRAAIDACGLCDDRGYLGTLPCAHDPDLADRTRARAAEARAAIVVPLHRTPA